MAQPVRAPCVNINDDKVRVVSLRVADGDRVREGDVLAEVETVKTTVEVTAERDGYVLKISCEVGQDVAVGGVMLWLGDAPDEVLPESPQSAELPRVANGARPTAKALELLGKVGLDPSTIPVRGERLTVADVEAHLGRHRPSLLGAAPAPRLQVEEALPEVPGEFRALSGEELGMATTVAWHRDQAAATYLELEYDPAPWDTCAAAYASEHRLMLSPLLPLMAFRLVEIVRAAPRINATLINGRRYEYRPINLGFTVQVGEALYLPVVRDAGALDAAGFIRALGEVQRHAMQKKLRPEESCGATVAFSSMARWNVSRHVPILPPHTSLIVAHAAPRGSGRAVLGATYDHRILSGFDVARVLQQLAQPPQ